MPRAEKWSDDQYVQFVFDMDAMINLFQRPVDVSKLVPAMRELREISFQDGVTPSQMLRAWNAFAVAAGPAMVTKLVEDGNWRLLVKAPSGQFRDAPEDKTVFSDGDMRVVLQKDSTDGFALVKCSLREV